MTAGRVFRIGAIVIVAAAVLLFGLHFGPARHQGAEAKVFERLLLLTRDMPEYLFDGQAMSKPRKVMINGNTTHIAVGRSRDDVAAVLDFYAKQYAPQPLHLVDEDVLDRIEDEEKKACLKRAVRFMDCMAGTQHFRLERSDFGFWGAFEFHDADLKIGTEEFINRTGEALSSGELGALGIGRVVLAMREHHEEETTIVTMWTDRDFDLSGFEPNAYGDVPGNDIESVPRYPGNRRILSIAQENSRTRDSVVVYEGEGSLAANILFYHGRMKQAGWSADSAFEELTRGEHKENVLFYTRGGRECTIIITEDRTRGCLITTIIDRTSV